MKKKLDTEDLIVTEGPMNAVALEDAKCYLGMETQTELTHIEEKVLRAKKKQIVTSSKKMERKVSREAYRQADRLE